MAHNCASPINLKKAWAKTIVASRTRPLASRKELRLRLTIARDFHLEIRRNYHARNRNWMADVLIYNISCKEDQNAQHNKNSLH